ncbi:SDR family NAD(P)-dependent oxidoreductase [Terrabacter sp. NPDC080008]|uniref:SDR family NAD(P)-dependent oxidoreductase n=1 Tax=Terrabacter sp. NPDC080008 TaxID=3155176 RepID=UPI00344DA8F9
MTTSGAAIVELRRVAWVTDVSRPGDIVGAAYSAAKRADDSLVESAATQLRPHGVACLAVYPGLVRTEGVMQFAEHLDLTGSQSPEGVGRAIAAMADDPELMALSGRPVSVAKLVLRYGVDATR